ncbi:MAG: divalent-cation tolerance protein CutA [Candidatus Poribacteria bacterium]|nr:divalent-cation tolerance protein CutA [Candidatus Poribacteria bacterium]
MEYVIAFVTTPTVEEAKRIAESLVERKLAACVNVIPQVDSYYWWNGKIESDQEAKLVIKTKSELMEELIESVRKLHSYEICEVTSVPIVGGNADYLKWIDENVK